MNKYRGSFDIEIDGKKFTLTPSLDAMENLVLNTNWDKHAKLILKKYKGLVMTSEEIGDKKASELGLFKAFNLYKTI